MDGINLKNPSISLKCSLFKFRSKEWNYKKKLFLEFDSESRCCGKIVVENLSENLSEDCEGPGLAHNCFSVSRFSAFRFRLSFHPNKVHG